MAHHRIIAKLRYTEIEELSVENLNTETRQHTGLFVDDSLFMRDIFCAYLEKELNIAFKGVSELVLDPSEVGQCKYDVLIFNITAGETPDRNLIRNVVEAGLADKIMIIWDATDASTILDIVDVGVSGILSRDMPPQSMVNAIRFVIAGEKFVPAAVVARSVAKQIEFFGSRSQSRSKDVLRDVEVGILKLVKLGKSNKEIAHELCVSESSIKNNLISIYRKLHVSNRLQAVTAAESRGFLI